MNTNSNDGLYLDDVHVGMRLVSGTHPLDVAQIKEFARQFDPQPFHLDETAADASLFKGLAASGWHTAAITMKLITTMRPTIAGGFIGAGAELNWPTAARAGDVLRVESEVIEIRPSRSRPDRGIVLMRSHTRNQRDEVRQELVAKLVMFRR
ncbi:MAG: MaoC family dehydratase [Gammaproteobacteria bacterium]